jgi:hypothetical protein
MPGFASSPVGIHLCGHSSIMVHNCLSQNHTNEISAYGRKFISCAFIEDGISLECDFRSAIKTAMLPTAPAAMTAKMHVTVVMVMANWFSTAESVNVVDNSALSWSTCNIPKRLRSWIL